MTARLQFLMAAAAVVLAGCRVDNRLYNLASVNATDYSDYASASIVELGLNDGRTDRVNKDCDPLKAICLAFLEFDEIGEFWDPGQQDALEALINKSKAGPKPPVVVTFIHGWKNNADNRLSSQHLLTQNGNIVGFEGALEFMKKARYRDNPVVGIFVGWRGDLISKYWPLRRQLSYFNREATAIRIPGASLTAALTRIMTKSHAGGSDATVIMIGHSFGGLLLERALSQAMADYIERSVSGAGVNELDARADLIVFLNSAAAASEGKQMLDMLKSRTGLKYASSTRVLPLFLEISSLGDAATRFAMPIGHGPTALDRSIDGSWRTYFSPDPLSSQKAYYLSTTAHMTALQSHLIVEQNDDAACRDANGQVDVFGTFRIKSGRTYEICSKPGRWNDTAYWAMQMPTTVVPAHSGFFNENLVSLLFQFLPDQDEANDASHRRSFRLRQIGAPRPARRRRVRQLDPHGYAPSR
jgi:hypothetical protein